MFDGSPDGRTAAHVTADGGRAWPSRFDGNGVAGCDRKHVRDGAGCADVLPDGLGAFDVRTAWTRTAAALLGVAFDGDGLRFQSAWHDGRDSRCRVRRVRWCARCATRCRMERMACGVRWWRCPMVAALPMVDGLRCDCLPDVRGRVAAIHDAGRGVFDGAHGVP